jgi:protein-disulfide isomerase
VPTDTPRRQSNRERLAARRAAEAAARAKAERRRRTVLGGIVGAVVVLVVLVAVVLVQMNRTSTSVNAAAPANTTDHVIVVGSSTAPVTVDLYEDFQCPNCKAFEAQTGSTIAQLVAAGTVQAHYHGMAFLDTSANDQYSTRALNAAAAVVAAAGPTGFQAFHDLLFTNQPAEGGSGLTNDQLVQYAAQAGASGTAVQQAIANLKYGDWVKQSTDQASKDGVTGTPTVLVAGKKLTDISPGGLSAAVSSAAAG